MNNKITIQLSKCCDYPTHPEKGECMGSTVIICNMCNCRCSTYSEEQNVYQQPERLKLTIRDNYPSDYNF